MVLGKPSLLILIATLAITACAAPAGPAGGQPADEGRTATPKRVVGVIQGDPHTVYQTLNPASRVRGIDAVEQLVAAGLTHEGEGIRRPQIAEAVPSTENGLWKVLPDGRMETTWRIKPGVQWHDGTSFTSEDLLFTLRVVRDKELPVFGNVAYDYIEGVDAPDARTITVRWDRPYIDADTLFSYTRGLPFAKHLLEKAYLENKTTFTDHPYWLTEYVGTGPFKLHELERGSHLIVRANDQYVLGRPKIDEIEVRFIEDGNTLMANILAGAVEITLGRGLSGPQAVQVRDNWPDGRMDLSFTNWIALFPQFINTNPAIVADLTFRRSALHAIDRQGIVDALLPGQSSVAHSWLLPSQPAYKEIEERSLVKYEYDPRKAAQMLEGLGYSRAPDGPLVDRAGQRLSLEVRTTAGDDLREKMLFAIADDWQRVGIGVEITIVPRQRAADLEYRATFPAFELVRNPNDHSGTRSIHSRNTALPENQYRVTGNRSRYHSPELDELSDRYYTTIPLQERREIMGRVVRHISENLPIMGILYSAAPTLISNRLVNVSGTSGTETWNAHEWDVRS